MLTRIERFILKTLPFPIRKQLLENYLPTFDDAVIRTSRDYIWQTVVIRILKILTQLAFPWIDLLRERVSRPSILVAMVRAFWKSPAIIPPNSLSSINVLLSFLFHQVRQTRRANIPFAHSYLAKLILICLFDLSSQKETQVMQRSPNYLGEP